MCNVQVSPGKVHLNNTQANYGYAGTYTVMLICIRLTLLIHIKGITVYDTSRSKNVGCKNFTRKMYHAKYTRTCSHIEKVFVILT